MSQNSEITRVSLVRHGEVHNPEAVYYGRLKHFGLSELGQRQARSTAESFNGGSLSAVYSSPLLRAHQTATAIATGQDLQVGRTRRLMEVCSPFDGVPVTELIERDWDLYSDPSPRYEQPADLLKRMRSFVSYARKEHRGGHVVGVSHGDPIAFTALWAAGKPPLLELRADLRTIGLSDVRAGHASVLEMVFVTGESSPVSFSYRRCALAEPVID